nr:MAG TPA: hypothetical protein [Caudoviricetes sp.]
MVKKKINFDAMTYADGFSFCDISEKNLLYKACLQALQWAENHTPDIIEKGNDENITDEDKEKKKRKAAEHLVKKRKYIHIAITPDVLYYGSTTCRTSQEDYYRNMYGFTFQKVGE